MAVLFITHKFPPATGGMEQQSYQLITGYEEKAKAHSIRFEGRESILMFFLRLRSRVKKMLETHPDITIIHLNDGLMAAFFILLRVNPEGRKLVVTLHGLDVVFPLSIYQKHLLPRIATKIDKVICVSHGTKTACLERNFPREKVMVINNGVNVITKSSLINEQINIPGIDFDKDKILLAIGRPVKRKGFSWFANEVMPYLDQDFKFVHIGNINTKIPSLYKVLPQRLISLYDLFTGRANDTTDLVAAANKKENRTILTGKLSDEHRDLLIQKSTLMVMPNIKQNGDMEGFGLVALEGAIMGKIVLASALEGITDAIHDHKNGYLVPTGDVAGWVKMINDSSKNLQPSEAFKNYTIENFSWSKMIEGYLNVFKTMEIESKNQ